MSVFSNQFKNNRSFRAGVLIAIGIAIGASGYPYLAPVVLPIFDSLVCDGAPGCSGKEIPQIPEIPKPESKKAQEPAQPL